MTVPSAFTLLGMSSFLPIAPWGLYMIFASDMQSLPIASHHNEMDSSLQFCCLDPTFTLLQEG